MSLRVRNLQIDVPAHEHALAVTWWADALGGRPRSTHEPEYVHLDDVRSPIGVHLQRLQGGAPGYHLDLETDDVEGAIGRLLELGARDVAALPGDEPGRVLADPAGLPFCVTTVGQQQHLDDDRQGAHLHVIAFDVPAAVVEAEAAFWAAAFDGAGIPPGPRHPEFTGVDGVRGVAGPIAVLVQARADDGPPRVHVDLHVPDQVVRDAEVARLDAAGAEVTGRHGHWVVLASPGGGVLCVVPDA